MILRKILTLLIAAILTIGSPVISTASPGEPIACATAGNASSDGCCGGVAEGATCAVACHVSGVAVNVGTRDSGPQRAGAPLPDFAATQERTIAWPPDTTPPKPFSA